MRKYKIVIEEHISKEFEVLASDSAEAMKIAEHKYNTTEFIVDFGTPTCKLMSIVEPADVATEWLEF